MELELRSDMLGLYDKEPTNANQCYMHATLLLLSKLAQPRLDTCCYDMIWAIHLCLSSVLPPTMC